MNAAKTGATTRRVLAQLRHDHRTMALLFVVPPVLIIILKYVFEAQPLVFDRIAPLLLGIFPMVMMFLVASITTLRERTNGTLERLMSMPLGKLDFILGYALAFAVVALLQAAITAAVMLGLLGVPVAGGTAATLLGAAAAALLGTALGLFTSAFAATEFQAVQFMPACIFPQLLVCGLFVAREQMAPLLQRLADVLPLTYSVDAMQQIMRQPEWTADLSRDLLVVGGYTLMALALAALTIRRQER